ncbi:MAG: hypothetical protein PHR25_05145, partial [Clostridia bacterium]|nr:hypothetical protein [Clostridia bacterium]
MKKNDDHGISLIVLLITIIVVLILAGTIFVNLTQNNIIEFSKEATFKKNIAKYKQELSLNFANKYVETYNNFNIDKINANS